MEEQIKQYLPIQLEEITPETFEFSLRFKGPSIFIKLFKGKIFSEKAIYMWVAEIGFKSSPKILEYVIQTLQKGNLGYIFPRNDKVLQAIVNHQRDKHQYEFNQDEIELTVNGVQSFAISMQALTNENDGIIIFTPMYYAFLNVITQIKRKAVGCPLVQKNGSFSIDFELYESLLQDTNNKMVVFCNPQNPTGKVWNREEMKNVGDLALKYNKILVTDEIFGDITLGKKFIPLASISKEIRDITITINSASKSFNLSGMGASYMILNNKEWHQKIRHFRINNAGSFFVNTAGQASLYAAYTFDHSEWQKLVREQIIKNFDYYKSELSKIKGLVVYDLEAGFLTVVDYQEVVGLESEDVDEILLEKELIIQPLDEFYAPNKNSKQLRINICVGFPTLVEAVKRLSEGIYEKLEKKQQQKSDKNEILQ